MRNELSPFRFAVCTVFFLGLFTLQAYAQEKDHAQDADHQKDHPNGIVQDWSRRHVVYPRIGPIKSLISLQHDPRAILSWQEAEREDWHRAKDRVGDEGGDGDRDRDRRHSHGTHSDLQRDWSIGLGIGTTAPAMYPAKYSFDVNAAPDCTNDFVVSGSTTGTPIPAGTISSCKFPVNVYQLTTPSAEHRGLPGSL